MWKINEFTASVSITPVKDFGFYNFTSCGRDAILLPWLVICANAVLYTANLSCSSVVSWLIRPGFWASYANYITNSAFSISALKTSNIPASVVIHLINQKLRKEKQRFYSQNYFKVQIKDANIIKQWKLER